MHALTAAQLFRATWPRHTAKEAARAACSPVATAKAWVQARFTPSADTLLTMLRENATLRTELAAIMGEWDARLDQADGGAEVAVAVPLDGALGEPAGPAADVLGTPHG